jgi:predicted CXXCH cytochrome family protein
MQDPFFKENEHMKKLVFALILGLLLTAAVATIALADNGPHGNFTASTDACASCHRAHTAKATDYLLVNDIYDMCMACHDGSGAYTNVKDGIYVNGVVAGLAAPYGNQGDKGEGLFGGGFENAAIATARSDNQNRYDVASIMPVPATVTSSHIVDGVTAGTVWGAGDIGAAPDAVSLTLECTSCHDPHGKAGRTGGVSTGAPIASYRLLRFNPTGSNGYETITGPSAAYFTNAGVTQAGATGGVYVADVATKWYTPNTNVTNDSTLVAYRSRGTAGTNTPWWSYVNMRGDSAGRAYVYQKPAFQISASFVAGSTVVSCSPSINAGVGAIDNTCAMPGNPAAGSIWNNSVPMGKLGYWCATCHDRYLAGSNARSTDSGDANYMFRHATTSVACVNCHTAHGTTAQMTSLLAQSATLHPATAPVTSNSTLLKMDNRGLCVDCHGYDVGWSTDALVTP